MRDQDPKLFDKIRLAINSLPGYGLICNDNNQPMLNRKEVVEVIDKIERLDRRRP